MGDGSVRGDVVPGMAPLPGRRTLRRKQRAKPTYLEQINTNVIASFKINPSYNADNFTVLRPDMGQCCRCLPISQRELVTDNTSDAGMRNIFDVTTELRSRRLLIKSFACFVFAMRRSKQKKYPDVSLAVLRNERVVEAIKQASSEEVSGSSASTIQYSKSLARCQKRARKYLKKMKASVSRTLIGFTGWFLLKFLSIFLRTIQVHKNQIKMLQNTAKKGVPVIYLPLHKSHLDYILVTFLLWNINVRAPYVAAGDNLDIPFFGALMKGLGGFFIRRKLDRESDKKDVIYRKLLQVYMRELLKRGESFEFFIEGGRTRSGKTMTPKAGLLSVVVDACIDGFVPDAYVVPLSISYERLVDGNFCREQMGEPKVSESFFGAVQGILQVICGNFGSVRIDFCQPFSIKEYIQNNPALMGKPLSPTSSTEDFSPSMNGELQSSSSRISLQFDSTEHCRRLVKGLAFHVVYNADHATALMCTNMLAFLLLTKHRQGAALSEVVASFTWLREELKMRNRDVGFCGRNEHVVDYACDILGENLVLVSCDDTEVKIFPNISLPYVFELSYYGNSVISAFLLDSILVNAVLYVGNINLQTTDEYGSEDVFVSRENILKIAEQLCRLLQHEFIFVPSCTKLVDTLMETLDHLVSIQILSLEESECDIEYSTFDRQWASRLSAAVSWADEDDDAEEDSYVAEKPLKVNIYEAETKSQLQFFHQVLAPIMESYLITAYHISHNLHTEVPEADFVKQLGSLARGKDQVIYAESAAMNTLKNAVKSYHDMGIIECYSAGNLRMVGPGDDSRAKEDLDNYIDILEVLKE
ncbi:glycerol-3-phosphate acyltransferase 1, mitochondrial-like [Gigantopelta aegis]|uniref:glycerol-3-phosphate acyltransferase 1, mitochondrial-like n=1 Tax=Gigantopelta aegis TaxID=1735272 RepID=UPI001B88CC91|nr:glycerol-3-phosphate acyltransferase 1, mitochondrial-like [Gigantopelta aegis]